MKKIGVVIEYNGNYGIIKDSDNKIIDFSHKDLFTKNIVIGSIVEFREEIKDLDLRIARNIKIVKNNDINSLT